MILVTGATGYIGSHLSLELISAGHEVLMIDSGLNSSYSAFGVLYAMALRTGKPPPTYRNTDILDNSTGYSVLADRVTTIFHFAGLKSLSESFVDPTNYFCTNLGGTASVLNRYKNCKEFIFSSSAAVYSPSSSGVFTEESPLGPLSPYGKSKLMAEQVIEEHAKANLNFRFANLRYFNPMGAHSSGELGENPKGMPNNLIPYVAKVAMGDLPYLSVYGADYPTADGTAIRDYVHIMDVVDGHLLVWNYIKTNPSVTLNLGSGSGLSVMEVVDLYATASKTPIPTVICPPRKGDLPVLLADYSKANKLLGWKPTRTPLEMCVDSWNSVKHRQKTVNTHVR